MLVFALIAAFVSFVALQIVLVWLGEHRTDVRRDQAVTDGKSSIWQVNVMRPSNYTPAGRRLLRWYYLLQGAWLVSVIVAFRQCAA